GVTLPFVAGAGRAGDRGLPSVRTAPPNTVSVAVCRPSRGSFGREPPASAGVTCGEPARPRQRLAAKQCRLARRVALRRRPGVPGSGAPPLQQVLLDQPAVLLGDPGAVFEPLRGFRPAVLALPGGQLPREHGSFL